MGLHGKPRYPFRKGKADASLQTCVGTALITGAASSCSLQVWASLIEEGEAPRPFSSRDGRLLRRIPPEARLPGLELQQHLLSALQSRLLTDSSGMLVEAWSSGKVLLVSISSSAGLVQVQNVSLSP